MEIFLDFPALVTMFQRFLGLMLYFAKWMFWIVNGFTDHFQCFHHRQLPFPRTVAKIIPKHAFTLTLLQKLDFSSEDFVQKDFSRTKQNDPERHSPRHLLETSFKSRLFKRRSHLRKLPFQDAGQHKRSTTIQLCGNPPSFGDKQVGNQIRANQIVLSSGAERELCHVAARNSQFFVNAVCAGIGARDTNRFGVKINRMNRLVAKLCRRNRQNSRTGAEVEKR